MMCVVFIFLSINGHTQITGESLVHRSDDTAERLQLRLEHYNQKTVPVVEYYRQRNILSVLHAENSIEEVWLYSLVLLTVGRFCKRLRAP